MSENVKTSNSKFQINLLYKNLKLTVKICKENLNLHFVTTPSTGIMVNYCNYSTLFSIPPLHLHSNVKSWQGSNYILHRTVLYYYIYTVLCYFTLYCTGKNTFLCSFQLRFTIRSLINITCKKSCLELKKL